MADPTTPLPAAKAFAEDERSILIDYLDYHRIVLARKAEGVTDEQARMPACPPSDFTLLALIRHMAEVERLWFRRTLLAEEVPLIYGGDDGEFHPRPAATLSEALATYWSEIAFAKRNITSSSLEDMTRGGPDAAQHTLRRVVVHMIEEYARHCGHADLLRQAVDGRTGD
jgi:uncharacterized damage-inducible protein DinB